MKERRLLSCHLVVFEATGQVLQLTKISHWGSNDGAVVRAFNSHQCFPCPKIKQLISYAALGGTMVDLSVGFTQMNSRAPSWSPGERLCTQVKGTHCYS